MLWTKSAWVTSHGKHINRRDLAPFAKRMSPVIQGWMKCLALLAAVALTLSAAGCEGEAGNASAAAPSAFESCPDPEGGGYDVWVQGMGCDDVTSDLLVSMPDAFGRYKSLPESDRLTSVRGPDGWVCCAALESDFGPIHNVCRRDEQTLIFYTA